MTASESAEATVEFLTAVAHDLLTHPQPGVAAWVRARDRAARELRDALNAVLAERPSVLAGHRCAFVRAHEHPHGAQIFGPDGADTYATWGLMGSPQQPLPATRDGIAAAVRRECATKLREFAQEHTGRRTFRDEDDHLDYIDRYANQETLYGLAAEWEQP